MAKKKSNFPDSLLLANMHFCPDLIKCGHKMNPFIGPSLSFAGGIDFLIKQDLGNRSVRKKAREYCQSRRVLNKDKEKIEAGLMSMLNGMTIIRKNNILVGQNVKQVVNIDDNPDSNWGKIECKAHYIYNRKTGPTYGIIIHDMLDLDEVLPEFAATHIMTNVTALMDPDVKEKNVETLVIYDSGNKWERLVIHVDENYRTFAIKSVTNALRRYAIEEKYIANWKNSCIRCPQRGRCKAIQDFGRHYRRNVLRAGQGSS